MKKIFLFVSLLTILTGCMNIGPREPLPVSGQVDIERFLGKWYVIGLNPGILDNNGYNITKTYQRGDRGIDIFYELNAGAFDGELKTYSTSAMVLNPGINTHWQVRIITWPFDQDYMILHVEPDYSACLVGTPNRNGLWIMSRTKRMDDVMYSDFILKAQALGYNVGSIKRVPHR